MPLAEYVKLTYDRDMRDNERLADAQAFMTRIIGPLTFGRFLRVWREQNEWTQVAAATKLGISKSRLCDIEAGRRLVSVQLARSIAKRFGAPETQAIECCFQDQLRKAKVANLRVRLVA